MPTPFEPRVGDWYEDTEGRTFEVVAIDNDEDSIEIQYFDGAVAELDREAWQEMSLQPAAEPKDWSGPFDDLERDDFGDSEVPFRPDVWGNPLDEI